LAVAFFVVVFFAAMAQRSKMRVDEFLRF